MPRTCVLAIDQGTTNTKALLLDQSGETLASASRRVNISFPTPGWVEQNADELWKTVADAIEACVGAATDVAITAVGLTNQRESVIVWDRRNGRPVGPCIGWQCRRTAPFCASLRARGFEPFVRAKTGLPIDPLFSASKARWLLDHTPDGRKRAADGELCIGTVDSWLLWNLTGGGAHACDVSNAARTQLLDLQTLSWDAGLLDLFGIPAPALPQIRASSGEFGFNVRTGPLPGGLPITSLIGDSHAALFGHGTFEPGAVKATYGTGTSMMTVLDSPILSQVGLATTVAWALPGRAWYALEGNITMTGGAAEWLGQLLGLDPPAQKVAELASSVADTGGVSVVPAFAGLGAPYWDADARGLICGLTRGTTAAHLARATLESIAYQVRDVFEAMRAEAPMSLQELLADGGAAGNDALMQFQSDLLGCPVVRNRSSDLSACGAAWLAGLAAGVWRDLDALRRLPRRVDRFEPRIGDAARARLYDKWLEAVARARGADLVAPGPRESVASSRHGSN